jgi:hypothetical protein
LQEVDLAHLVAHGNEASPRGPTQRVAPKGTTPLENGHLEVSFVGVAQCMARGAQPFHVVKVEEEADSFQ